MTNRRQLPSPTRIARWAALCLLVSGSDASAQIRLISQERSVSIDGQSVGETHDAPSTFFCDVYDLWMHQPIASYDIPIVDSDTTLAMGTWNATAIAPAFPNILASQNTSVSSSAIHGTGSLYARNYGAFFSDTTDIPPPPGTVCGWDFIHSGGEIRLTVVFEVEAPVRYDLSGLISSTYVGQLSGSPEPGHFSTANVKLTRAGGTIFDDDVSTPTYVVPPDFFLSETLDRSGMLAPGSYILEIVAEGETRGFWHHSQWWTVFDEPLKASFDVDMTFTTVPAVPSFGVPAWLVLTSGIIATAVRRLRSRETRA